LSRIRSTPIHHHFHLAGWSEPQVVVRFWLLSIAFVVIAPATLKLRQLVRLWRITTGGIPLVFTPACDIMPSAISRSRYG
jgi:hypothetical protein